MKIAVDGYAAANAGSKKIEAGEDKKAGNKTKQVTDTGAEVALRIIHSLISPGSRQYRNFSS